MASDIDVTQMLRIKHDNADPAVVYTTENSLRLHPAQRKLIQLTVQQEHSVMLSSAEEIQLLQNVMRIIGAKKTLDIGVYTGYSAMSMALALPVDGKVVACDISDHFPLMGKPIWEEAGVVNKIELVIAPASNTLQRLLDEGEAGTFDFAFIDADKTNYDNYYEMCLKLLRPGGIIALDNMLWGGSVYNPEKNAEDTVALRNLGKKIHKDDRVNVSFLTIGDGTILAFKK